MKDNDFIQLGITRTADGHGGFSLPLMIEERGWYEIEKTLEPENSKNVFVAMWFDSDMNSAYAAIEEAIQNTGFDPVRIDRKEHNNEISGEILYEITKSRFLIADVTGQRAGVYFEAGYAMGLGIPVIWTCREDDLENVHFDTRQYSHVVWKNESELATNLANRIKGTILLKRQ